jgi:hypothetical protein
LVVPITGEVQQAIQLLSLKLQQTVHKHAKELGSYQGKLQKILR